MSTPQDPGSGQADDQNPQDPSNPQNPYGTPPPPTTPIPPAPSIYGTEPPAPPPSQPTPPPYGQPTPPSYGDPAVPPPPPPTHEVPGGSFDYGQPAYSGAPAAEPEPGKGLAIGALISSILGCTCIGAIVGIVLATVVLVRSRDGRNHGKGLAIAALVISVLSLGGLAVGGYFLYDYGKDFRDVSALDAGDCIDADGLSDASADSVSAIRDVPCAEAHDGEVLATLTLTEEQLGLGTEEICGPAVEAAGKSGVLGDGIEATSLTELEPEAGDKAVCVAYRTDGSKLTGRLGS